MNVAFFRTGKKPVRAFYDLRKGDAARQFGNYGATYTRDLPEEMRLSKLPA
jgi:hypothetical protein